jgi:hypothetical protein
MRAHSHTGFDALHGPAIRGELSHPDHDRLACALANGRAIPRADTYAFSRPDCGADDAAIGCSIGDAYLLTITELDLCADAHAHWRAHPFTIVSDLYTRPNRPADAVSEPHARAVGRPQCHADDAAVFGSDSDAVYAAVAQAHANADRTSVRRADSSAHADPDGSAHARSVAVPHAAPHGTTFGAADGCADPETDSDTHGRADTPEVHHAYCAVVDMDANARAVGHPECHADDAAIDDALRPTFASSHSHPIAVPDTEADVQAQRHAVGTADSIAHTHAQRWAHARSVSRSDGDPHGSSVGAADGCAEREAELDADRRSEDRHADSDTGT